MSGIKVKKDLYYTKDHEWVYVENGIGVVGVSDYAQHHLGDIVYVELPELDDEFEQGDDFAVIESVKAASDTYLPLSGKIVEINEEIEDSPATINESPYEAWLVKIKVADESELAELMKANEYEEYLDSLEE